MKAFNKKAQESSFGMSFSMLFSIFLIVVFIVIAFIVIKVFLGFSNTVSVGKFYDNLQDEVNNAWRSSETSKTFKLDLNEEIEYICFMNVSAPATANDEIYKKLPKYFYESKNVYIYPSGAAEGLDSKYIDHLDIDAITALQNPYCVKNPGELTIYKGMRSKYVTIS